MTSESLVLRRGGAADLPFVMATERMPGFDALVGRWDEARHGAALADGRHAYFIASRAGEPTGFAIFRDWASPERVALLKRIAVSRPGAGLGTPMLRALTAVAFRDTDVHRIWLGVFPDNARARRVYEKAGFQAEGIARGSAFFGGAHRDELIMAILRTDGSAAP